MSLRRAALAVLASACAVLGLLATLAPHAFYRHVVGVDMLGPYDGHLVTDVGELYLGFAVLFAWSARTLTPELVRVVCAAFALVQVLHLGYHVGHLRGLPLTDAIEQLVALALLAGLPAGVLYSEWVTQTGPG